MTRIIMVISVAFFLLVTGSLFAQEPPTPSEVANTVSNLWISQDFTGLNSYVTNLYASTSNYVPAILASVFHDSIYLGKLSQATSKLARVQGCVVSNPQGFTVEFKDFLSELASETKEEIDMHAARGRTPETVQSNASAQTVRSVWGTDSLPQINILFYAPATNAP